MKACRAANIVWIACALYSGCGKKEQTANAKKVTPKSYTYEIVSLHGNVSWSDNRTKWHQASEALKLWNGTLVETGSESYALLQGSLGDMVMLGERTRVMLTIEELTKQADRRKGLLKLLKGTAFLDIRKGLGQFRVQTASARVDVKGTNFSVTYDPSRKSTDVAVAEGNVEVREPATSERKEQIHGLAAGEKIEGVGTNPKARKRKLTLAEKREMPTRAKMQSLLDDTVQRTREVTDKPSAPRPPMSSQDKAPNGTLKREAKSEKREIAVPSGNFEAGKQDGKTKMEQVRQDRAQAIQDFLSGRQKGRTNEYRLPLSDRSSRPSDSTNANSTTNLETGRGGKGRSLEQTEDQDVPSGHSETIESSDDPDEKERGF